MSKWARKIWQIISIFSVIVVGSEAIVVSYAELYLRKVSPEFLSQTKYRHVTMGTGFSFTNEGLILTSGHVARGCRSIMVSSNYISDIEAQALTSDFNDVDDLAVLTIKDPTARTSIAEKSTFFLAPDDTSAFNTRNRVFGYSGEDRGRSPVQVPVGKVIRVTAINSEYPDNKFLALSGKVRQGQSGSPVLDEAGLVTGVIARATGSLLDLDERTVWLDRGEAVPVSVVRAWLKRHQIDAPSGTTNTQSLPLKISCYSSD